MTDNILTPSNMNTAPYIDPNASVQPTITKDASGNYNYDFSKPQQGVPS